MHEDIPPDSDYFAIWGNMDFSAINENFLGEAVGDLEQSSTGTSARSNSRSPNTRQRRRRDSGPLRATTTGSSSTPCSTIILRQRDASGHVIRSPSVAPVGIRQNGGSPPSNVVEDQLSRLQSRVARLEILVHQIAFSTNLTHLVDGAVDVSGRGALSGEISRGELDRVCLPVLQETAEPSHAKLSELARELETTHRHINFKIILSQVRKWFRKRREEMGTRITAAFRKFYGSRLADEAGQAGLIRELEEESLPLNDVIKEARLDVGREEAALIFARCKCISFIKRLSSQPNH